MVRQLFERSNRSGAAVDKHAASSYGSLIKMSIFAHDRGLEKL
jgi:hypothetical protein